MNIKVLIASGCAVALVGGAASAQVTPAIPFNDMYHGYPLGAGGKLPSATDEAEPALNNSELSPNTVNPPLYSQTNAEGTAVSSAGVTGPVIMVDGEARVAVGSDVAARLGLPVEHIANAPIPDTPENRALYGGPLSNAGRNTTPAGN